MAGRSVVRMVGPLAPYAAGFDRELRSRGYTRLSAVWQLRLMAHVSRWLASEELDGAAFTPERAEEFCAVRRRAGYTALLTPRALAPLQEFLRGQGVLAKCPSAPAPDLLVGERGLVPAVVSRYLKAAALFLDQVPGGAVGRPALDAAAVSVFCARELPRNSRTNAANLASALRSFLRFLHVEGLVGAPVAQAVPAVANRKGQGLPRALPPATVARLLASCDRRTRLGRRDYAMLMLLARLGLRAGEVASLSLDDIGWRAGELTVHGKGGRDDRLPLPADVGAALAAWLRIRPKAQTRAVFLRANAPIGAISPRGVAWAVYNACDRSGVPRAGAHRLRHSLATQMLGAGASLAEVGQVLRHARVATTAIYAKVDHRALDALVLPWPGDGA
jgi:integrase/recombinase XerD